MRTTKKEFCLQVRAHIESCLSEDYHNTLAGQLQAVADDFGSWYCAYERRRQPHIQTAFIDWMNGLPSALSVEYTYHGIHETMKAWFAACGETYRGKQDEKEVDLYRYLVYRELLKMMQANGVRFVALIA